MANTTFNGPVRSQNGFQDITTNASTGAVTVNSTYDNDASIGGTLSVTGVATFAGNAGPAAGTGITTGTGTLRGWLARAVATSSVKPVQLALTSAQRP
mgnify:CR=1 FL=1